MSNTESKQTESAREGSLERVVSEQTFADQIRLAGKARKYSKRQLVAELLESDRMLRADARQIKALGDEVKLLKELLANATSSPATVGGKEHDGN